MKTFEYMSRDVMWPTDGKEMDILCELGKIGWELCATAVINWYIRYYFKRELTDSNRKAPQPKQG